MSITLKNISKTFDSSKAVDNISITFHDGELTALLGPSGSGKTTLLRLVAGLENPDYTEGSSILFNNIDVIDNPVAKRKVGFVFQHYALFRHMTVFENIAFGLRVKKRQERPSKEEIKDRVYDLLKLIQLDNMANRMPSQLSGGQRQRVALARALAIQPKVLLLDEPFGALDAKVRSELRRWLRRLHDDLHITSIFVTHDQEEALEVADRIVVMNQGRIEQTGPPEEVFNKPLSEFVMRFLGEVNVFRGRIEDNHAVFAEIGDRAEADDKIKVMIRPHEFDMNPEAPESGFYIEAFIQRVITAGPFVKIELTDKQNQTVYVHLSHDEYNRQLLDIKKGVFLTPRNHQIYWES